MAIKSTGLLTKGLRSEFFNRFMAVPTMFGELSTRVPSTTDKETYRWLGTVPQMREFGTGRLAKGLRTESYDVTNQKYEATLEVDRDEISDDQTGQIRIRVAELAQRAATHKDYLLGLLMANGHSAGFHAYDGKPFFSTTHESGDSGVQDNNLTKAKAGTAPTVQEFKDAVQLAIQAMLGFKDDQGEPMHLSAASLKVVTPPQLYFTALEALTATMVSNTTNVLASLAPAPVVFPWLTTSTEFFVLKTDGVVRPFLFQDREPIEFTAQDDPESEEGFKREKYLYGVRARYRMTYGYWQYAVKVAFTGP